MITDDNQKGMMAGVPIRRDSLGLGFVSLSAFGFRLSAFGFGFRFPAFGFRPPVSSRFRLSVSA